MNNKGLHGGVNKGDCDRINLIIEYYEKVETRHALSLPNLWFKGR